MSLYAKLSAKIKVNGRLSDAFSIHYRTKQACPLPPLLYILTLEPLLQCIRANTAIRGIHVWDREFKIVPFADNVLLFLSLMLTSLPNLLQVLKRFKILSNLKMNYAKSFALNVCSPFRSGKTMPAALSLLVEG